MKKRSAIRCFDNIYDSCMMLEGARARQATPGRSSVFVLCLRNQTLVEVKFGANKFVIVIFIFLLR